MKRVALFGGSFDPPHFGHVLTISHVLNSDLVDEVRVVPVGDDRYDKPLYASAEHREEMVRRMILSEFPDTDSVKLETIQLEGKLSGSTTTQLLDALEEREKDTHFSFVIGADNIEEISKWKSADSLMQDRTFIVVSRLGEDISTPLPPYVTLINDSENITNNFSSSIVREHIGSEKVIAGMVPHAVVDYIRGKALYGR